MKFLLDFAAEVIESLLPLIVVNSYEQGVLFRLGNPAKLLKSTNGLRGTGLHLYIPLIDSPETADTVEEVLETSAQAVTTSDMHAFTVSCSLTYEVVDLRKRYRVQDFDDSLEALVKQHFSTSFMEHGRDALLGDMNDITDAAMTLISEDAAEWGVNVSNLALIDISPARTINLVTL